MKRAFLIFSPAVILFGLGGCGKPPASGGAPPADMPVSCVVAPARRERLEERLPLVGSLRAPDAVRLLSEAEGKVERIGFEEGSYVEKDTVLFELDRRKEEARMAEAQARLTRARSEIERGRELLESKTIPPQEFDRLQEALATAEANAALLQATMDDTVIEAPFAGLVGERSVSRGQFVTPGTPLGTLTRIDPLEVEFAVPERFISQLKAGQTVRIKVAAFPGEETSGEVVFLAPVLDSASRTLRVKAEVRNPGKRLRPGMFGTVELVFEVRENALVIPEAAARQRGEAASVVAVGEDRRARFQPVDVGLRLAGRVEITSGLKEGEIVIVEGHQKVAPGSKILFAGRSEDFGVKPDPPAAGASAPTP